LGKPGGEGTVFGVSGQSDMVVKIYHSNKVNATRQAKVRAMVANKPRQRSTRDRQSGKTVPVLAWPEDTVLRDGQVCGFTMRAVDMSQAVEIHNIESPFARDARPWTKDLGLGLRANIALNLAFLVGQVHSVGAVIGDFNERNVLVSKSLLVCMIDCDSMQIRDSSGCYPCTVFQSGFFAPELIGKDLNKTVRRASSDLFSLAVHIYCLLLDRHPFRNGIYTSSGEKPANDILAKQGQWRGRSGGILKIEKSQIDPRVFLPPGTIALFERAFQSGAANPDLRPSASEWEAELRKFIGDWKPRR
jgi:DNA-binding helix-hairpin-helix protein with protein kinase domain